MSEITLSFVMTTYNKLTYLKIVLERLIASRREDEEIIVTDGGSKDGSAQYLQQLYDAGKIQKFVSEKDFGEGHGFNKGMLMAEGKLIKLLTDDDAYDFNAIAACKKYMLENPHIDYLNTHGGSYDIRLHNEIFVFTDIHLHLMQEWKEKGTPFACCMLGSMLNRKSLPFMGLLNPSIKRADAEYGLRITSQKITMAWYLGVSYVRVLNGQSNSVNFNQIIAQETQKLNAFYDVFMDYYREEPVRSSLKDHMKRPFRIVYRLFFGKPKLKSPVKEDEPASQKVNEREAFEYTFNWLDRRNSDLPTVFITNV